MASACGAVYRLSSIGTNSSVSMFVFTGLMATVVMTALLVLFHKSKIVREKAGLGRDEMTGLQSFFTIYMCCCVLLYGAGMMGVFRSYHNIHFPISYQIFGSWTVITFSIAVGLMIVSRLLFLRNHWDLYYQK